MARSLDIFIGSRSDIESLINELETILGVRFTLTREDDERYYRFWLPPIHIAVSKNELKNDREMNFEDYQYSLGVWAYRVGEPKEWMQAQDALGRYIFDKLRDTGKHPLMLVDDVQRKLDEFRPKPPTSS